MTEQPQDVLWKNFPRTDIEFERRFASEADCRAYWIEARWGGKPATTGAAPAAWRGLQRASSRP